MSFPDLSRSGPRCAPVVRVSRWSVEVLASPAYVRRYFPRFAAVAEAAAAARDPRQRLYDGEIWAAYYPKTDRVKLWRRTDLDARANPTLQRCLADALLAASRGEPREEGV